MLFGPNKMYYIVLLRDLKLRPHKRGASTLLQLCYPAVQDIIRSLNIEKVTIMIRFKQFFLFTNSTEAYAQEHMKKSVKKIDPSIWSLSWSHTHTNGHVFPLSLSERVPIAASLIHLGRVNRQFEVHLPLEN